MSSPYSQHDLSLLLLPPLLTVAKNLCITLAREIKTTINKLKSKLQILKTLFCTLWILGVRWVISKSTAAIKKTTYHQSPIISNIINNNINNSNSNSNSNTSIAKVDIACVSNIKIELRINIYTIIIPITSATSIEIKPIVIVITTAVIIIIKLKTTLSTDYLRLTFIVNNKTNTVLLLSATPFESSSINNPPGISVYYWTTTIRHNNDIGKYQLLSVAKGIEIYCFKEDNCYDSYITTNIPIENNCIEGTYSRKIKFSASFFKDYKRHQARYLYSQELYFVAVVATTEGRQNPKSLDKYLRINLNLIATIAVQFDLLFCLLLLSLVEAITLLTASIAIIIAVLAISIAYHCKRCVGVGSCLWLAEIACKLLSKLFIKDNNTPNNINNIDNSSNNIDRGCIYYCIDTDSNKLILSATKDNSNRKEIKDDLYQQYIAGLKKTCVDRIEQQINCDLLFEVVPNFQQQHNRTIRSRISQAIHTLCKHKEVKQGSEDRSSLRWFLPISESTQVSALTISQFLLC